MKISDTGPTAGMLIVQPKELARALAPAFGVEVAGPINGLAIDAAVQL
jgi:hypothetical protein